MQLLIDTHVLLWAAVESADAVESKLSDEAQAMLLDGTNQVFVSAGSLFELAVKASIGKLTLPDNFIDEVTEHGYELLPVAPRHLTHLARLPLRHRDPFDRLLVSQAAVDRLVLLTADAEVLNYAEADIRSARR